VDEAHLLNNDETSKLDEETKQFIDQIAKRYIYALRCLRNGSNPNHDPVVDHVLNAILGPGNWCNPE